MQPFTKRVVTLIQHIPEGKVMTYGQIALLSGSPRAARQVVRILHSMSRKYNLPWHRVINSKGEIGLKDRESFHLQRSLLEAEGVEFIGENKVELEQYIYSPTDQSWVHTSN